MEGLFYTTNNFKKKYMFFKKITCTNAHFSSAFAGPIDLFGFHQTVSVRSEFLNVFV